MYGYETERIIVEKLLEALRELPLVHTHSPEWQVALARNSRRADARVDLEMAGIEVRLLIEVKKSVYPRDVRDILWQIRQFGLAGHLNDPGTTVPLLAAESISPGARDLLRAENVGYYDLGGSLFVPGRGAYIYIDKPPSKTLAKTVHSLFQGKRSQVLHALLLHPDDWFSVKALAELAKVSPATASETLSAIERFDWISSRGQGPSKGRRLMAPGLLLDEWAKQATAARTLSLRRYYVPSIDPASLAERLDEVCDAKGVEYVLTQETAAQLYAPFLTNVPQVKCRIVPGRTAETAISDLGARAVSEGANLMVADTKSPAEFLFKRRIGRSWLASPVQVYVDLLRGGGRAKEMAEHLRKEKLGF